MTDTRVLSLNDPRADRRRNCPRGRRVRWRSRPHAGACCARGAPRAGEPCSRSALACLSMVKSDLIAVGIARGVAASVGDHDLTPAHVALGVLRELENPAVAALWRASRW